MELVNVTLLPWQIVVEPLAVIRGKGVGSTVTVADEVSVAEGAIKVTVTV